MEARRSKRTRNAPKPIYEVEDKRLDEDGSDGQRYDVRCCKRLVDGYC